MTIDLIRFAWWNTGLSPPYVQSRATPEHRAGVTEVLDRLIRGGCSVVALAEVRREDVLNLLPSRFRGDWGVIRDTSGDRNDFDVAIAYDNRAATQLGSTWVREYFGQRMIRCGLVAEFGTPEVSSPLVVVAAHWRTDRGDTRDSSARRTRAAEALRHQLGRLVSALGSKLPILVMGDFNSEPFDEPFVSALPTARDRATIAKHQPRSAEDLLLYNASWRWIGERQAWATSDRPPSIAGTYRVRGSRLPSAWRTFDQVLVSGSLLSGDDGWSLYERNLGPWPDETVYDLAVEAPRAPFDHVPIVGSLVRT